MRVLIPFAIVTTALACAGPPPAPATGPRTSACPEPRPRVCEPDEESQEKDEEDQKEPKLVLEPAAFSDLPGWEDDAVDEAVPALVRSCDRLSRRAPDHPVGPDGIAGTARMWRPICRAARALEAGDTAAARRLFERRFAPFLATNHGDPSGRFTGYYEALMHGARERRGRYEWPIYRRPPELVMVYLHEWYDRPAPRRVAGRVEDGRLRPYYTRKQIMNGALRGRGLEIFWVDDPVDAFFAQVQGSGVVQLPDGERVRVGYAAKNGHPYTAIGRILVRDGEVPREQMSMQAIRRWLTENPDRVPWLLEQNEAFVFFERETRPGAIGAQGVVLTPERSMAVDTRHVPLSAPIFVVTDVPDPNDPTRTRPFRQLVIAQDAGGAIRGPVRGDLFWGVGERATTIAGHLKGRGRYYLLLPRSARAAD